MNVTKPIENAFLINKGGFGTDREGFNINYGLWLGNREELTGDLRLSLEMIII
ncbi:MAG TPA: hypothetical protein VFR65_03450 [Nitrososphaeraceae archaeon]|nr:hypothetical protein [Nitrososphaeraceae archaeon]